MKKSLHSQRKPKEHTMYRFYRLHAHSQFITTSYAEERKWPMYWFSQWKVRGAMSRGFKCVSVGLLCLPHYQNMLDNCYSKRMKRHEADPKWIPRLNQHFPRAKKKCPFWPHYCGSIGNHCKFKTACYTALWCITAKSFSWKWKFGGPHQQTCLLKS
jgi:hypothetical protein